MYLYNHNCKSRTDDNLPVYLELGYVKLKVIVHSYITICQNLIKSTGPKPSHINCVTTYD